MRRPTQQFTIDVLAAVAFVLLIATGVLMKYVLPPGSGRGATVLMLDRHGWGDIHFWIAVVMVGLIIIHLLLHSRWIATMVKGKNPLRKRQRASAGIVIGVAMIFVIILPLLLPVHRSDSPPHGGEHSGQETRVNGHGEQSRARGGQ
jgi:amino acid transporter